MKSITKTMVVAFVVLMAVSLLVAPVAARAVAPGSTVYVGEKGLDLSGIAGITRLVHYSDFAAGAADNIIDVTTANNFELTTSDASGITGTYYAWNAGGLIVPNVFVVVKDPTVGLDVVLTDFNTSSVNGKSVTRATNLSFKITDNLGGLYATAPTMNIEVTTPGGAKLTQFGTATLSGIAITGSPIYSQNVVLSDVEAGTYTAMAKWPDGTNFSNLPDSGTVSFEVTSKTLAIESNKDSVIRGNSFVVTVTGESKHTYFVYINGDTTNAPTIAAGQTSIVTLNNAYNATVRTDASGVAKLEFTTNGTTKAQTVTIKTVDTANAATSDDVKVTIEKGAVTATASGTGVYYVGEDITLTGTNTDSNDVYLFLTGPNLGSTGNGVNPEDLYFNTVTGDVATFGHADVETDDTWEYKWDTSAIVNGTLDSGTYTIYAASKDVSKADLDQAKYSTVPVVLKTPFITATASSSSVAKGDRPDHLRNCRRQPEQCLCLGLWQEQTDPFTARER